jgi:hypothetical protein
MKTSEDGLVIEFEKGEEIILDREYEWINATAYDDFKIGRKRFIRGLKASKSDLEKFIDLYRSVGIELEPVVCRNNFVKYGSKMIKLKHTKIIGNSDSWIFFDKSGKFIQQGIWE